MSELSADGLTIDTLEIIRSEINSELGSVYGTDVTLDDDSFLGRLVGVVANRLANLNELAEEVNNSSDPDSNTGTAQDNTAALSGVLRENSTYGYGTLTLTGVPGTTILTGNIAEDDSAVTWVTTEDGLIVLDTSWLTATAYVVGDYVTSTSNVYVCVTAGTSTNAPYALGSPIDVVLEWLYLGSGTGHVDVEAGCGTLGAVAGTINTITTRSTSVTGWDGVKNQAAMITGTEQETDGNLRIRREQEISGPGTSPRDAIRADILKLAGVTACRVFENNTDITDADGVPSKSNEVLVTGGLDQDVYDALYQGVASGILTHGTETGAVVDSEGFSQVVKFSRATEIDIYATLTLTYDDTLYPSDGDDQIAAAIVAFGVTQSEGKDAVSGSIAAQAYAIPGVLDVSLAYIDTSPTPTAETTIAISTREKAVHALARIIINSSAATP